jgi:IgA peptidase M64
MERLGGPDLADAALQLNFIGDGFLEDDLPAYRDAVGLFWTKLLATAPFDRFTDRILGVRLDVISDVGGISLDLDDGERDEQQSYEDLLHSGAEIEPDADRDTPFKASLARPRLIVVDTNEAQAFVRRHVQTAPSSVTVVVANTPLYGGSGAEHVPVFSLSRLSADIAIHELGHAAFGLADEYTFDALGRDEPLTEPNVDDDFHRAQLKWAHLVNVADADLGVEHALAGDGPHVGAFKGAKYRTEHAYRPEFDCRMRTVNQPFCAVCREVIEKALG